MSYKKLPQAEPMDVKKKSDSPTLNKIHNPVKPTIQIGNATVVPNNDIARLMYYLHSVKNCIDAQISSMLVDYMNYRLLTEEERRDVVIYAHRYRPAVLRNIIFFEVDDNSYMLPNSANVFLAFDDPVVIGSFNLPSNAITVDGIQSIIRRVMVFKADWMHDYFQSPFHEEKWRIGLAPKPIVLVHTSKYDSSSSAADVPLWCFSGVLCCFLFPPVGLALLAVGACRAGQETARVHKNEERRSAYVVY